MAIYRIGEPVSKEAYVYMMTNHFDHVIYTGVTSNLIKRVYEHKYKLSDGFTGKHKIDKLVYFEKYYDIKEAIEREKQIKAGKRFKKAQLIENRNIEWRDLYYDIL